MDRVERRLIATSAWLSYAGRLQQVNSVISTLPTYAMCIIKLPAAVIDNMDIARKQCLWRGSDINKKDGNLASWNMVCKPKDKGGLGILNRILQNDALLLKHLHNFYTKKDLPCVSLTWEKYYKNKVPHVSREVGSFWWKDVLRLNTIFRGIARCTVSRGDSVLFWDDLWTGS